MKQKRKFYPGFWLVKFDGKHTRTLHENPHPVSVKFDAKYGTTSLANKDAA